MLISDLTTVNHLLCNSTEVEECPLTPLNAWLALLDVDLLDEIRPLTSPAIYRARRTSVLFHRKLQMAKRSRTSLVNAFNIVPVVEQILPDRQKIEVG